MGRGLWSRHLGARLLDNRSLKEHKDCHGLIMIAAQYIRTAWLVALSLFFSAFDHVCLRPTAQIMQRSQRCYQLYSIFSLWPIHSERWRRQFCHYLARLGRPIRLPAAFSVACRCSDLASYEPRNTHIGLQRRNCMPRQKFLSSTWSQLFCNHTQFHSRS